MVIASTYIEVLRSSSTSLPTTTGVELGPQSASRSSPLTRDDVTTRSADCSLMLLPCFYGLTLWISYWISDFRDPARDPRLPRAHRPQPSPVYHSPRWRA